MKGKKRLPTEIKKAKGTLRKCRTNPNEPQYPVVALPDPPGFFGEVAKSIYYEVGNTLLQFRVLRNVNIGLLVAYAKEFETWYTAKQEIDKTGNVATLRITNKDGDVIRKVFQINPYHRIANDAFQNMIRVACELGITPASSSKIVAIMKPIPTKDKMFD